MKEEMWEILTPETWLKEHAAMDKHGNVVPPHHENACRFSIIGALIRCYLKPGELWSPDFEENRIKVINRIVRTTMLRHIVQKVLKYTTLTKLPLGDLNARVEVDFIAKLVQVIRPPGV